MLLRFAERLVPARLRDEWREEYTGAFFEWTLEAAEQGTPDSRFAVLGHTRRAVRSALRARFSAEQFGTPAFFLGAVAALLVLIAIASGGFQVLRHYARPLKYREPDRVVVLAQGPPFFGIRLGFRDRELYEFRERSHNLEGVATYHWNTTVFQSAREITAAEVGPEFFNVLGVGPSFGRALDGPDTFLASYDFWKSELGADRAAMGRSFDIGGHPMRLTGVMPHSFSFLSAPISVWVLAAAEPQVPARRWWLALRGAVARLRPEVRREDAEKELRRLLADAGIARRNFSVQATPVADLVYRPAWSYGFDFAAALSAILGWAAFNLYRDRRRGSSWSMARRFWAFFVAKSMLPLTALFLFMFEFGRITRLGVTGGIRPGTGALNVWLYYSAIAMMLLWAFRDQPGRCRVCLNRMRQPIRIGTPGQVLLENAGQEVMCPQGHGSIYTADSVLGADISNRWMGFP